MYGFFDGVDLSLKASAIAFLSGRHVFTLAAKTPIPLNWVEQPQHIALLSLHQLTNAK
jgi:hypothetical protein